MSTLNDEKVNWEWADEMFHGSEFADSFCVDDCEFDEEEGMYMYFDEIGSIAVVDAKSGKVYMVKQDE